MIGALVSLLIATSLASAFEISPECKKLSDPIGCTCALQNGGAIRNDGRKRWVSKLRKNGATNEAFVQCQIRARGHS
jgi:hypothetical protein